MGIRVGLTLFSVVALMIIFGMNEDAYAGGGLCIENPNPVELTLAQGESQTIQKQISDCGFAMGDVIILDDGECTSKGIDVSLQTNSISDNLWEGDETITNTGGNPGTTTCVLGLNVMGKFGGSDNAFQTIMVTTSICGDGIIEPPEECDDLNLPTPTCDINCMTIAPVCGDGIINQPSEQCDDGNQLNNDACLNDCKNAFCGDFALWQGVEECDDGNLVDTDACVGECKSAFCGDMFVRQGVEDCEPPNTATCDALCMLISIDPICSVPLSGDWTVPSSCTLDVSATAPANVIVPNGVGLTVESGVTFIITSGNNLLVKSGGVVQIESGGTIIIAG